MPATTEHTICCADFDSAFTVESDSTDKHYTVDGPHDLIIDGLPLAATEGAPA